MRAECRPFGNRPIYYSVRADSGIDHSKENPSFIAGAVGGRGSARLGWPEAEVSNPTLRPFSRTDFVRVSIGNRVTAGGSQARRGPTMVLLHVIGRIIRLRSDHAPAILWDRVQHGNISTELRTILRRLWQTLGTGYPP